MKQIILLEPHEVARLQKGKTLMISTQAGEIGLQFTGSSEISKALACEICGATTNMAGKPFHSQFSLTRHMMKMHKKGARTNGKH